MKRLVKGTLRRCWSATAPLRRPVVRKLDAFVGRTLAHHLAIPMARIERIEGSLVHLDRLDSLQRHIEAARSISENLGAEANLLMDSLVREITRLQLQVEDLRDQLEAAADRPYGFSVLAADGGSAHSDPVAAPRVKAG